MKTGKPSSVQASIGTGERRATPIAGQDGSAVFDGMRQVLEASRAQIARAKQIMREAEKIVASRSDFAFG